MEPTTKKLLTVLGVIAGAAAVATVAIVATTKSASAATPTMPPKGGVVGTSPWIEQAQGATYKTGGLYYLVGGLHGDMDRTGLLNVLKLAGWDVKSLYLPGDMIPTMSAAAKDLSGKVVTRKDNGGPVAASPFDTVGVPLNAGIYNVIAYWRGPPLPNDPIDVPIFWAQSQGA